MVIDGRACLKEKRKYETKQVKAVVTRLYMSKGRSRMEIVADVTKRMGRAPRSLFYDRRTGYCSFV